MARKRTPGNSRIVTPPTSASLPDDYANAFAAIKSRIEKARLRVVFSANAALVRLYWDIGQMIRRRQGEAGWGTQVIERLSADIRTAFPEMKGFSPRSLTYMRRFAAAWPRQAISQEPLAKLPWSHHLVLIEKLGGSAIRLWYARQAIEQGWSQHILVQQIQRIAHDRQGRALTNFKTTLPAGDSDLAQQIFRDPYLFDFIGTADLRREREVEQALMDHVQQFLLELGSGFAFVGRQIALEVGEQDFVIDLLFYHLKLRCYVVVELKAVPFDPAFVGQLNLYLSAVDDLMRHPDDEPTIGLLLCRGKDRIVVEYALRNLNRPVGVSGWETTLVGQLPTAMAGSLPTVEEIEAGLGDVVQKSRAARTKLARQGVRRSRPK